MSSNKLLLAVLLAPIIFSACKTSEKNYRAAYEVAAAHAKDRTGLDETIYAKVRKQAQAATLIVDKDSLPMQTEVIGYTQDGGASQEMLQKYNIVVGRFKQLFNAQDLRQRLKQYGYPESFILHTREPLYYVITKTSASPTEARDEFRKVEKDSSIVMKNPLPFVLVPAHLARR